MKNVLALVASRWAQLRGRASGTDAVEMRTGGPLDDVNDAFHAAYAQTRRDAQWRHPVFVIIADALVVLHENQRQAFPFSPVAFHILKSVAHAPLALFVAPQQALSGAERERWLSVIDRSESQARDEPEIRAWQNDVTFVLDACRALLLSSGDTDRDMSRVLADFASRLRPALLRLVSAATTLQLSALHRQTERAFATLPTSEHGFVHVVVAGAHQARERSLAMQYFQRRFREAPDAEWRVTYAEGVTNEREAFELVGIQRLDRAIASAFFGDVKRLQRDVLGDAAEALLRDFQPGRFTVNALPE